MIPVEPCAHNDDQDPMWCNKLEQELYNFLYNNALDMERLLPIKWCNKVLEKLRWIDSNRVTKLNTLLTSGTLNTSLSAVNKPTLHETSTKTLKENLNCPKEWKQNFVAAGSK